MPQKLPKSPKNIQQPGKPKDKVFFLKIPQTKHMHCFQSLEK